MPSYHPAVDEFISKSAEFAQPILKHLRELIHKACPQVEETIKWTCPHFMFQEIRAYTDKEDFHNHRMAK